MVLAGFVVFLAGTSDVRAQSVLRGVVSSGDGRPVSDAIVQLTRLRRGTATGADGRFQFDGVAPGTYALRVTRIGFTPVDVTVAVPAADSVSLAIELTPAIMRLADIVVTPGRFGVLEQGVAARQTRSREEIEAVPQVGEDVFRAVRRLPGVATGDISTRLNVRGGTDDQLLIRLDGMELYDPYHLKDFDGVFGFIDVQAVGGIDLSTGGFSAEYGDKLTGVFDMYTRKAPPGDTRTALGLSITNLSLLTQGGFDGGNGEWLLSARRGYLDVALALAGGNDELSPRYGDLVGKVEYQVARNHRLSVHGLFGSDALTLDDDDGTIETGWANTYGWVTWAAQFGPRFTTRTMAFGGHVTRRRIGGSDDTGLYRNRERINVDDDRTFDFAGAKVDASLELTSRLLVKAGVEFKDLRAGYRYFSSTRTLYPTSAGVPVAIFDTVDVDQRETGQERSAYAAVRVRPLDPFVLEVGARYDQATHVDESYVTPRVLASWQLGVSTVVRASWGRYYQSHGIHELDVGDGETSFYPADRSYQIAAGIEHRFGSDLNLRLEAYRRRVLNQRPRYVNTDRDIDPFPEAGADRLQTFPGPGDARGIEVLAEHDAGRRWAWSVGYVLAVARDLMGGRWVPRTFDQRHTLSTHFVFRPDARWNLSWGFQVHSGWPATEWLFEVDSLADGGVAVSRFIGELNGLRLPVYHRLDLRVTRTFTIGSGAMQVYLDLFNAYDRENLRSYSYNIRVTNGQLFATRHAGETLLPILPSLGLRYEF